MQHARVDVVGEKVAVRYAEWKLARGDLAGAITRVGYVVVYLGSERLFREFGTEELDGALLSRQEAAGRTLVLVGTRKLRTRRAPFAFADSSRLPTRFARTRPARSRRCIWRGSGGLRRVAVWLPTDERPKHPALIR